MSMHVPIVVTGFPSVESLDLSNRAVDSLEDELVESELSLEISDCDEGDEEDDSSETS